MYYCLLLIKKNEINMWKAMIKLVEKWAYRCDHEWQLLNETSVLDRELYKEGIKMKIGTEYKFACKKCLMSKKII